jgi:hypothetical protein
LDLTKITVLSGLTSTLVILLLTAARQRSFEPKDFYPLVAAFLAGSNVPPSIFLCLYVFYPDPLEVATKLRGYEKYIFLAGLSLLLVSLMALWKLIKEAHKK